MLSVQEYEEKVRQSIRNIRKDCDLIINILDEITNNPQFYSETTIDKLKPYINIDMDKYDIENPEDCVDILEISDEEADMCYDIYDKLCQEYYTVEYMSEQCDKLIINIENTYNIIDKIHTCYNDFAMDILG